jgi:hypothetical protein
LGGGSAAGKVISGAENETDAMRRLKADGNAFQRPLVVDWNQGKAGEWLHGKIWREVCANFGTVVGENESEIMKLIRSVPKETEKV